MAAELLRQALDVGLIHGSRANYVIVDDEGWRLYYSHWGAQTVHRPLAAGPAAALGFIVRQEPSDPRSGWLDDRWAEGGALVDIRRRHLLFFGGFEFLLDLPYRRAYFRLLEWTWTGWTVQWAVDVLGDFVRYLALEEALVRVPELRPEVESVLRQVLLIGPPEKLEGWDLLTVRTENEVVWLPVDGLLDHAVWAGPGLITPVLSAGSRTTEVAGDLPWTGVHVDVPKRRVAWWTAATVADLAAVPARWPGWTVQFMGDDYEQHAELCAPDLRLPTVDVPTGFDEVERDLARSLGGPVARALSIAESLQSSGEQFELNPAVAAHVHVEPGDREAVLDALAAARRESIAD